MSEPGPPQGPPPTAVPPQGPPPGAMPQGPPRLTYADFVPSALSAGGVFSQPQYEPFSVLIQRANQWLAANPVMKAKTCESLEVKAHYNSMGVDTQTSTYMESGKHLTRFIRTLRLWLVPREPHDPPQPQQLGYLNVVPGCTSQGGLFTSPTFEPFGNCINQLNNMFRQNPLPGRILNVETQDMKFKSWSGTVDPDCSTWYESGDHITSYLNVIRVFYEHGPPMPEEVGCIDFQPACMNPGGFMSNPQFQSFGEMFMQASAWMQQQAGINIVNMQSVEYKISNSWNGAIVDTQRSIFTESGKFSTFYLRILRVVYTRPVGAPPAPTPPPLLTYRTFMPGQVTQGGIFTSPGFETMSQNMNRVTAWVNLTGAKVVAAETVPIQFHHSYMANPELTFNRKSGDFATFYVFAIRLYLEGTYQDPPLEMLPPMPVIQPGSNTECCAIL